jgi:hypothetical protein
VFRGGKLDVLDAFVRRIRGLEACDATRILADIGRQGHTAAMEPAATLLDARALLYGLTLLVAIFADVALLVAAVLLRARLGRGAAAAAAAPALHGLVILLASAVHYASARSEASRFGAEAIAVGVFNVGAWGMAIVHLGGATCMGLFFFALLRVGRPGGDGS